MLHMLHRVLSVSYIFKIYVYLFLKNMIWIILHKFWWLYKSAVFHDSIYIKIEVVIISWMNK